MGGPNAYDKTSNLFGGCFEGEVLYIGHASRVLWLVIHNTCEGDWRMEDISTSVCCFNFMYMYHKIVE